jgi:hypothetical protein
MTFLSKEDLNNGSEIRSPAITDRQSIYSQAPRVSTHKDSGSRLPIKLPARLRTLSAWNMFQPDGLAPSLREKRSNPEAAPSPFDLLDGFVPLATLGDRNDHSNRSAPDLDVSFLTTPSEAPP